MSHPDEQFHLLVDAVKEVATLAPALMPVPARDAERMALFAPAAVFHNPVAQEQLGDTMLRVQHGLDLKQVAVASRTPCSG